MGDLDGDGFDDLVVFANEPLAAATFSLLSSGTGDLLPGPLAESGVPFNFPRLGYVDGDLDLDLICMEAVVGATHVFRRGRGDGDFDPPQHWPAAAPEDDMLTDIELADIDMDGELDVLTSGFTTSFFGWDGGLELYLGDGTGGFSFALRSDPTGGGGFDLDAADLDLDGLPEVVMAGILFQADAPLYRYENNAGTLMAPTLLTGTSTRVVLVDMDLDGLPELLTTPAPLTQIDVRPGLGASFGPSTTLVSVPSGSQVAGLAVGDMDGDGLPDLVIQDDVAQLHVARGDGANGILDELILSKADGLGDPQLPDLDGDGLPEIVFAPVDDQKEFFVVRNATYGPGEAFEDLGHVLPGSEGWPILVAEGSLANASPFSFRMSNGVAGGTALIAVGASRIDAPFKGGTLVPYPDALLGFVPLSPEGTLELAGTWPVIATGGFDLWFQFWFQDPGAIQGWAATSAVVGHVP